MFIKYTFTKVYVHKVHIWVARGAGTRFKLIFEFVGLSPLALNIVALKEPPRSIPSTPRDPPGKS